MADNTTSLGPILLEPLAVERIWGVPAVDTWYAQPQPGKLIGEMWLTAAECAVQGHPVTLGELSSRHPAALANTTGEGFPLLLKVLYPREKLSVQVHPNDEQARTQLDQPRGKTECWYVLSAEPGAQVAVGFREPMTPAQVRQSIEDGSIEARLQMIEVQAGDMVFVDAGTVHAIGPGMVVLETQQYSDVTYRLWDYGRPRELHLDAGMAVLRTHTQAGPVAAVPMDGFDRLVSCPYFTVDRFRLKANDRAALGRPDALQVLIALGEGGMVLRAGAEATALPAGRAVVLPAGEAAYLLQVERDVEVIRVFGPQA